MKSETFSGWFGDEAQAAGVKRMELLAALSHVLQAEALAFPAGPVALELDRLAVCGS